MRRRMSLAAVRIFPDLCPMLFYRLAGLVRVGIVAAQFRTRNNKSNRLVRMSPGRRSQITAGAVVFVTEFSQPRKPVARATSLGRKSRFCCLSKLHKACGCSYRRKPVSVVRIIRARQEVHYGESPYAVFAHSAPVSVQAARMVDTKRATQTLGRDPAGYWCQSDRL